MATDIEDAAARLHGELLKTDGNVVMTVGCTSESVIVYVKRGTKTSGTLSSFDGFKVEYVELSPVRPSDG